MTNLCDWDIPEVKVFEVEECQDCGETESFTVSPHYRYGWVLECDNCGARVDTMSTREQPAEHRGV